MLVSLCLCFVLYSLFVLVKEGEVVVVVVPPPDDLSP